MEFVKLNESEKEKLNLIENREEEIINILDQMAIFEFSMNYNLGEYSRVADINKVEDSENYKSFKKQLEDILNSILEGTEFTYKIMNFGTLSISHSINATTILEGCSQEVLSYRHKVNLPYAYVMGKKVGKKNAIEWLKENVL